MLGPDIFFHQSQPLAYAGDVGVHRYAGYPESVTEGNICGFWSYSRELHQQFTVAGNFPTVPLQKDLGDPLDVRRFLLCEPSWLDELLKSLGWESQNSPWIARNGE